MHILQPGLILFFFLFHTPISAQMSPPTAGAIIQQIQEQLTCDWDTKTVDTYKGGSAEMEVTGIATTFLATLEVLKQAKAQGLNLIITHEPTFYNHLDETEQFGDDKVIAAKQQYIKDNQLIVWRFHDHWHRTEPDGIYRGVVKKLGWEPYETSRRPYLYTLPKMTLSQLVSELKERFPVSTIRVVGDPEMTFTNASLVLGSPGYLRQIERLQRDDVEVMIGGETHEWETVEYVRDAVNMGKKKALVLIGHANSEEAGMDYCADWLKTFIQDVPVMFIPAGDPFWSAGK